MIIDWEQFRRADGSIDLCAALLAARAGANAFADVSLTQQQRIFLERVEALTPIKSTQVAALALTQASAL